MKADKRWLETLDAFLDVVVQHLLNNEPVKAYTAAMQIRQSVTDRIEGIQEATES